MGSWGPGVFQNDHALDWFSIAVSNLGAELEKALDIADADWTDIEGPLVYVHLLAVLAEQSPLMSLKASTVVGWRKRYVDIYDSSRAEEGLAEPGDERRAVIATTFEVLLRRLPTPDPGPHDAPKPASPSLPSSARLRRRRGRPEDRNVLRARHVRDRCEYGDCSFR